MTTHQQNLRLNNKRLRKALQAMHDAVEDMKRDGKLAAECEMKGRHWKFDADGTLVWPCGNGVVCRMGDALDEAKEALAFMRCNESEGE